MRFFCFGVALILLAVTAAPGEALLVAVPGRTQLNFRVRSLVELRFKNMVRQTYDLSCGAAALATILKYYYGDEVTEREVIEGMVKLGDKEKIRKFGFSLLEMKWFAEKQGYMSGGFRVDDVKKLIKLKVPAITLMNVRGYNHFVVIKGIAGGEVFIADPAFGNRSRPLKKFAQKWNGVILVVLSTTREGRNAFALEGTLKARASDIIPILERGLQTITPGPGEF